MSKKKAAIEPTELAITIGDNPQVFISHDTRDAEIAEVFCKLLSSVTAGVLKTFRSSDNKGNQGIDYGVEWYPKIVDALQKSSDVVCLLTDNSINRPWILFEAGMAKGKLNTAILGVAVGVQLSKASTGPFAQFQNCADDEDSLTKLVKQLVKKIPNSEPDEEVVRFQVQQFKKKVEEISKKKNPVEKEKKENKLDSDAAAKLFEEVKVMFKELPSRIEVVSQKNKKGYKRFHRGMLDELFHFTYRVDPKLSMQICLSPIKENFPWIYDGALECIDKIQKAKSYSTSENKIAEFMRIVEISFEHPALRDFFIENEYDYAFHREIPRIIYEILQRTIAEKKIPQATKAKPK